MTTQTRSLSRELAPGRRAGGWLARLGRALAEVHREAFVSRHEIELRVLADINAPQVAPTPEELRDAWRLWHGGDVLRHL